MENNQLLQQVLEAMETQTQTLEQMVQGTAQRTKTELLTYIESHVEQDIKLLAEGHQVILGKLAERERIEELEQRVKTLERILESMKPA